MKVKVSPRAREDLRAAVTYLMGRHPIAAVDLKERLLTTIDELAAGTFQGAEVQLHSGRWVRSWPVTPYRIYYQRTTDQLRVIRVYHQARGPIAK